MVAKRCLMLMMYFTAGVFVVRGAPSLSERRPSESIDKSAELHEKLRLLHKQIHDLVAEQEHQRASEDREKKEEEKKGTEDDVTTQLRHVHRLRDVAESQLVSERQKEVQMLATHLDQRSQNDLHELSETLDQLLRETMPERGRPERTNTAGEFLGDKYNNLRELVEEDGHFISKELPSEAIMERRKTERQGEAERLEEEEEEEEEEEDADVEEAEERKRLQAIYKMLVRLYKRQHTQNGRGREEEEEEEEPAKREKASLTPRRPADGGASHFASRPDFLVDEGTFGDFVDSEEESGPSDSAQYREELRKSVLTAIERRLLQDLQDARTVGVSVDDIIGDVQEKVTKEEHLRHIEKQLDRLPTRE